MTTQFRVVSDLHLESNPTAINDVVRLSENKKADILLLAGDIVTYKTMDSLKLLEPLTHLYDDILYIPGNHEYYHIPYITKKDDNQLEELHMTPIKDINKCYSDFMDSLGITMIEKKVFHVPDTNIQIIGTTLWSNVTGFGFMCMADSRFMYRRPIIQEHKENVKFIYETLNNSKSTTNIVMTHHMPSLKLIDEKYKNHESSGFATDLDPLIRDNHISSWVYGHTHARRTDELYGVKTYCNPYGYKGENGVYEDMTFELKNFLP